MNKSPAFSIRGTFRIANVPFVQLRLEPHKVYIEMFHYSDAVSVHKTSRNACVGLYRHGEFPETYELKIELYANSFA